MRQRIHAGGAWRLRTARTADRAAAVVTRVLGATHPFAALGLPPRETEAGSVKAAYRKAALAVHPDKCAARGGEA